MMKLRFLAVLVCFFVNSWGKACFADVSWYLEQSIFIDTVDGQKELSELTEGDYVLVRDTVHESNPIWEAEVYDVEHTQQGEIGYVAFKVRDFDTIKLNGHFINVANLREFVNALPEQACVKQELKLRQRTSLSFSSQRLAKVLIPATTLLALASLPGADGGPALSILCGVACKAVATIGCGAGALIVGTLNPGVGVLYAAICAALDAGAVGSCMSICLALPSP